MALGSPCELLKGESGGDVDQIAEPLNLGCGAESQD